MYSSKEQKYFARNTTKVTYQRSSSRTLVVVSTAHSHVLTVVVVVLPVTATTQHSHHLYTVSQKNRARVLYLAALTVLESDYEQHLTRSFLHWYFVIYHENY